jgi:hypothetical protein
MYTLDECPEGHSYLSNPTNAHAVCTGGEHSINISTGETNLQEWALAKHRATILISKARSPSVINKIVDNLFQIRKEHRKHD